MIFIFLESMCSVENEETKEMCETVSTQLQTLIKANLNDSGYNFLEKFIDMCQNPENNDHAHCNNFDKGNNYFF